MRVWCTSLPAEKGRPPTDGPVEYCVDSSPVIKEIFYFVREIYFRVLVLIVCAIYISFLLRNTSRIEFILNAVNIH